jgi:ElaB/YqjD/DUF883 family membrane-anchored ribosome-binding protein
MHRTAEVLDSVDEAVKSAGKSAGQVSREATAGMKAASDSLRGGKKRLARTARQAVARTDRLVQSNYWSAIGIAAAAGATIAAVLSLRLHR